VCSQLRPLKRVNYFAGQLLTEADLTAEQEYQRDVWRRHNRCFHGWGVVCGLDVTARNSEISITPGLALDCQGDEIVLPAPSKLYAPTHSPGVTLLYVLIKAEEELIDPVPGPGATTEYSRAIERPHLVLDPKDPTSGHVRGQGHGKACGSVHGVPLARVKWERRRWRLDARYKRHQANS
jgi:hypothetical protein